MERFHKIIESSWSDRRGLAMLVYFELEEELDDFDRKDLSSILIALAVVVGSSDSPEALLGGLAKVLAEWGIDL